jgi:hypothetical protein
LNDYNQKDKKMTHFRFLIFANYLFFSVLSNACVAQGYLSLSGKIVDAQTQKPIANAYIGLLKRGTGTITNDDGQFVYRFPRIAADSSLVVAVAGYRTFQQKASLFSVNQKDIVIQLEPVKPQVVDSSFIRRFEARDLVIAAVKKTKINASTQPYLLTGFYKETLQQNNEYIEIKEAILQTEKDPRPKTVIPEKTREVKNRLFQSENQSKALVGYSFPNGASIVTHSIDMGLPEYLDGNNLFDYNYQLDDTLTFYLDKSVYRVRFWPVLTTVKGGRNGVMTINSADSAIVRIEYDFTANGMKDILKTGAMDKIWGDTKRSPKRLYTCINYKPYLGKWYLQDYQLLLETEFKQAKNTILGTIKVHFVTTEIMKSNGWRIAESDILMSTDHFSLQTVPKYDDTVWANYNYIISTEAMRQIVNSSRR